MEEAIARAFDGAAGSGQGGEHAAGRYRRNRSASLPQKQLDRAELSIFRPIKCMLATPEPTAEAVWERFVQRLDTLTPAEVDDRSLCRG